MSKDKKEELKEEKVLDLKDTKKKKATRAKKLSGANAKAELDKVRDVKKVELDVNGTKYYYEIDGVSTTTKQADFINNIKAIVAYTTTETSFDSVTDEEIEVFMASMLIAEIMHVYSSLEVGTTIEEKVSFITTVADLGILEDIGNNIPDGILEAVELAEKEISKLADDLTKKANEVQEKIAVLEELNKEEEK